MSHPNPHHDIENERIEDSKFAPKKKSMAKKMKERKQMIHTANEIVKKLPWHSKTVK